MSIKPIIRVRSRALIGFSELVTKFGGDSAGLLKSSGISPESLTDPESTVDHLKVISLYEHAAEACRVSDFGLRLAEIQGPAVLGPVALTALHAPTVSDAIMAVSRNIPYHSPGATVSLTFLTEESVSGPREMACMRYVLNIPENMHHRQNSEIAYAIAMKFLEMSASLNSQDKNDLRIHFSHAKGLTKKQYQKHLGCEVRLGQPFEGLFFPKSILQRRVNTADPLILDTAQRFVSLIMRRYPLDIAMQVETLLVRQLANGACTMPLIARQLFLSARSLQRRLLANGTTFDDI